VNRARAAVALLAVALAGFALVSGGSGADPRTPAALPGLPAPFLGTAVVGSGELTAAIDAYGDVVDLRPSPAGPALIENPSARQAAGTVPADTGIVPRVRIGGGPALALWRADSVRQRHLPGTNVAIASARFGRARARVVVAARGSFLAVRIDARGGEPSASVDVEPGVRCARARRPGRLDLVCAAGRGAPAISPAVLVRQAARDDRRWLARARPLQPGAPSWARRMYGRSLLTLRALTDARTGAPAAGARDGWAHVWPRDAATAALALQAAGYRPEARRIARFLRRLDLGAAARFGADGRPVPGRGPQGDAPGWVAAAARATGVPLGAAARALAASTDLADAPDYQEGSRGDYLANALAQAGAPAGRRGGGALDPQRFRTPAGLVRRAGDSESGLDSAAAWAVRPFSQPALYGDARRTLARLLTDGTPYGITPGEGWGGGTDPWMAPTAWSAWSFAALARRESAREPALALEDGRRALRLLADLRRAATPAGELPERVDARTGVPRSTTPLAWPHAFAVLTLRELWPAP